MRAADGGEYASIQGRVWHHLADTVYCVAHKRLELWRFLNACGMKTGQYSSWPQLRVWVTRPLDAVVGKLTEGTATDWASAVLYTLINGNRSQCTVKPGLTHSSQWSPRRRQEEELQRGQTRTKWTILKDETSESPCQGNWRYSWVHPILPMERSLLSLRQTRVRRVKKPSVISSTGN